MAAVATSLALVAEPFESVNLAYCKEQVDRPDATAPSSAIVLAWVVRFKNFGTATAARIPSMIRTAMISMRVNPPSCLVNGLNGKCFLPAVRHRHLAGE